VCELGPLDTGARVRVSGAVGSVFSPHCARVQPAKLARGLAAAVEGKGVEIFERSPALSIDPGVGAGRASWRVRTPEGEVRSRWVVRATEGFTARLPGLHRRLLPMNSSMIVTEPLPGEVWDAIGWCGLETLRDGAHVYTYLQRTADRRIAIGGRGVPYRFGSRFDDSGHTAGSTISALTDAMHRLFPSTATAGLGVAHAWSGVLGVARDWCPAVGVDRCADGGLAWAGGYVGDGVTTSYLAGLTLANLILGRDTPLTNLPWVGHTARNWEPEPMRWAGARGIYALYRAADRSEARRPGSARTSVWATVADRVSGRG
jgi:glycine/D-amino acid oxidase-like deaminating enzyme